MLGAEEETAVEEAAVGTEVMRLESFGRLKTPPTGEIELSVDCKQNLLPLAIGAALTSQKFDADVNSDNSFLFFTSLFFDQQTQALYYKSLKIRSSNKTMCAYSTKHQYRPGRKSKRNE